MKIAICSQNRRTITPHAGQCRNFLLYEIQNGLMAGPTLLEVPMDQTLHSIPDGCAHALDGVDALVARTMGLGVRNKLAKRGIKSYWTSAFDPLQAVSLLLNGKLPEVSEQTPHAQARAGSSCCA